MLGWCVAVLAVSGCATFEQQPTTDAWQSQQSLTPETGPDAEIPGQPTDNPGGGSPQTGGEIPPPEGCKDYNPAVIGTCMKVLSSVAALPSDPSDPVALVAERQTGRILRVRKDTEPVEVAKLDVDGGSDGGLTGLALSPTYAEDQLVFAYVTTASDNRLVRIAPGDTPKAVLIGIPKGPSGNHGALGLDHKGALLLATGDAGNPSAATDQRSLAGKVLRIDASGKPLADNPNPASPILTSGLHSPGGVCSSADGSMAWVTDRGTTRDSLFRLMPGKPLTTPAWSWPDRPGVAGCISWPGTVSVATSVAGNLQNLPLAQDGSFSGKPAVVLADKEGFGRLGGLDLMGENAAVAGTVNNDGGSPVSSDDRAIVIQQQGGGGSGAD